MAGKIESGNMVGAMRGKEIRQSLHAGRFVYSTAVISTSPQWATILPTVGIDFVFIDTEHTPIGRETLAWMCRAYAAAGLPPVVRIPSPDPFAASMVLDGGAGGFIAPYVESAEQVRSLVGAARHRPLKGRRLRDVLEEPASRGDPLGDYLDRRNAETILILNIESAPAIENLDSILAVEGVDAVLIGPHDLSCSLGIPEQYDHPRFDEAVRKIFSVARGHGVGAGIHFWESIDREVEWSAAGGNLIMHSSDLTLVQQSLQRDIAELRRRLGDDRTSGKDAPIIV